MKKVFAQAGVAVEARLVLLKGQAGVPVGAAAMVNEAPAAPQRIEALAGVLQKKVSAQAGTAVGATIEAERKAAAPPQGRKEAATAGAPVLAAAAVRRARGALAAAEALSAREGAAQPAVEDRPAEAKVGEAFQRI